LGDTLFGQLCWAARNRHGEERLTQLLEGYTQGQPFAVVSDALPTAYLPRPALPTHCFDLPAGDRKAVKKRAWLPVEALGQPVENWLQHCKAPADVAGASPHSHPQPHNTLNRESGTTGNGFDPYAMEQLWYSAGAALDVYILLDETRLSAAGLKTLLDDMGRVGFGRDASIGLGKFEAGALESAAPLCQAEADAFLTLAPCAPQGLGLDPQRSFYQPFTRFGRHGDIGVHLRGGPFKAPVLLAQTGAVFSPLPFEQRAFIGQGLGGGGTLSNTIKATVHQGYAPVVGIRLPVCKEKP
jgi:CRISPR-associated protein Csm4